MVVHAAFGRGAKSNGFLNSACARRALRAALIRDFRIKHSSVLRRKLREGNGARTPPFPNLSPFSRRFRCTAYNTRHTKVSSSAGMILGRKIKKKELKWEDLEIFLTLFGEPSRADGKANDRLKLEWRDALVPFSPQPYSGGGA